MMIEWNILSLSSFIFRFPVVYFEYYIFFSLHFFLSFLSWITLIVNFFGSYQSIRICTLFSSFDFSFSFISRIWPKAVGSLEKPWRWKLVARISKSVDKFATILADLFCYHSILETFVLSIVTLRREFLEDKENFLGESLSAQFPRYYIFGFIFVQFREYTYQISRQYLCGVKK